MGNANGGKFIGYVKIKQRQVYWICEMNKKEKIKRILEETKKYNNIKIDPKGRGKNVHRLKNKISVSDEIVDRLYENVLWLSGLEKEPQEIPLENFSDQQDFEHKKKERRKIYERLNRVSRQRWHAVTVGNEAAAKQLDDEVNKLLDYLEENI